MELEALQIGGLNCICHSEHSLLKYLKLTEVISLYTGISLHLG
jgi:hypothetical protein